jgi:hypothetical protein
MDALRDYGDGNFQIENIIKEKDFIRKLQLAAITNYEKWMTSRVATGARGDVRITPEQKSGFESYLNSVGNMFAMRVLVFCGLKDWQAATENMVQEVLNTASYHQSTTARRNSPRKKPGKSRRYKKPKVSAKTKKYLQKYNREFINEFVKGKFE